MMVTATLRYCKTHVQVFIVVESLELPVVLLHENCLIFVFVWQCKCTLAGVYYVKINKAVFLNSPIFGGKGRGGHLFFAFLE